mmetsp:Transcript_17145/g.26536  ORF Transcript_17145/g.26536 Transcript_17145/m.26536 type:complete len:136 (-) Transcript_17145:50-457(-)
MVGKRVCVLMADGTNRYGHLKKYDFNINLLLENATERVFPDFDIEETGEALDVRIEFPPRGGKFSTDIVQNAGLFNNDEELIASPGITMLRGDKISVVFLAPPDDAWMTDPLPRLFAWACARRRRRERELAGLPT